jgi:hypothetical protein
MENARSIAGVVNMHCLFKIALRTVGRLPLGHEDVINRVCSIPIFDLAASRRWIGSQSCLRAVL